MINDSKIATAYLTTLHSYLPSDRIIVSHSILPLSIAGPVPAASTVWKFSHLWPSPSAAPIHFYSWQVCLTTIERAQNINIANIQELSLNYKHTIFCVDIMHLSRTKFYHKLYATLTFSIDQPINQSDYILSCFYQPLLTFHQTLSNCRPHRHLLFVTKPIPHILQ